MPTLTPPRAILFDLDDTIIADAVHVDACWADAIAEHRHLLGDAAARLPAAIRETYDWFWSDPTRHRDGRLVLLDTRRALTVEALRRAGLDDARLGAAIADRYSALRYERTRPFDGAIAMLETLRATGKRLALVTNGSAAMQREKIARFNLAPHFDAIVVEGEFGHGKPDPRVYAHALASLDVEAADAWMIGDNLEWDVFAPMRQGITGVWHDVRKRGLPENASARPDHVVAHVTDLLPLVERVRRA